MPSDSVAVVNDELVAAAVSAHAALGAFLMAVGKESSRAGIAGVPTPAESPATVPPGSASKCEHKRKRDIRTFGVAEAWCCEDCGYEFRR